MGDRLQYSTSGSPRKLAFGSNKRSSVGPLCGPQPLRFPCFEAAADDLQTRCDASDYGCMAELKMTWKVRHMNKIHLYTVTMATKREILALANRLDELTDSQLDWVRAFIDQFHLTHEFTRYPQSDIVTEGVLQGLGDLLRIHHAMSRQALSKAPFEYAFEKALNRAGHKAVLNTNPTNPGHDITINGVAVSLKTEAATGIKKNFIRISKWMEMGRGDWDPPTIQLPRFRQHLRGYSRIFTLRCLVKTGTQYWYELVEIPASLLEEATEKAMRPASRTKQQTTPYYCEVFDESGHKKFALYFDAGTERKLQIKDLRKNLCRVHATWKFESTPLQ